MLLLSLNANAQQASPDELFQLARKTAFEQKNYPKAIQLSKEALAISPDYTDIRIFLGRLYTWSNKPDSARTILSAVFEENPANDDAALAYGSLEYWNDKPEKALEIVNRGLEKSPKAPSLMLLKARILNDTNQKPEASRIVGELLKLEPKNTDARALAVRLKDNIAVNRIGISYDFIHFDKQFDVPWHLASLSYGRQTKLGSVGVNLNYANRFKENGYQAEVEAYPRISNTFYSYVSAAYSENVGVFPKFRAGFSLYANLPAALEAEAGLRFLRFDNNTFVYTAAIGKYYKNYWINLRTYLTPSNSNISQSYSLNLRYYYGGADDFLSLGLGTGISPDDNQNNILLNTGYRLKSNNISLGYRHTLNSKNIIGLGGSWLLQEFRRDTWGNQLNFSATYQIRF
jgi:YaiO family outer membrane protein